MSEAANAATRHGRAPCTWCRRKFAPWQPPRPPTFAEAEVARLNQIAGLDAALCTLCARFGARAACGPSRAHAARESVQKPPRTAKCSGWGTEFAIAALGRPPRYCSPGCRAEADRTRG